MVYCTTHGPGELSVSLGHVSYTCILDVYSNPECVARDWRWQALTVAQALAPHASLVWLIIPSLRLAGIAQAWSHAGGGNPLQKPPPTRNAAVCSRYTTVVPYKIWTPDLKSQLMTGVIEHRVCVVAIKQNIDVRPGAESGAELSHLHTYTLALYRLLKWRLQCMAGWPDVYGIIIIVNLNCPLRTRFGKIGLQFFGQLSNFSVSQNLFQF